MEIQLKQRVIGVVVIFTLIIIFLPMIFQDQSDQQYVEQILEPPIEYKRISAYPNNKKSEDFMADSLDNIVLHEGQKTNDSRNVTISRFSPATTKDEVKSENDIQNISESNDDEYEDSEVDAFNVEDKLKTQDQSQVKNLATQKTVVEQNKRNIDYNDDNLHDRTSSEVFAIKLENYADKEEALIAKQKLLDIGFPAYITKLNSSYNLYVGPELETKFIKALAKRITEETQFTPKIVVHNSDWQTE